MLHKFALILILSFLASCFIHALDQTDPFPTERRVIFSCLSWDDEIETLYFRTLVNLNKQAPLMIGASSVNIASSFRSESQSYLGPAVLEFYSTLPSVNPISLEKSPKPVASVLLPPNKARVLLLFIKQAPTADHPNLHHYIEVLSDDLDNFPMGGYLLKNSTSKNLIATINKQSFELAAHSTKSLASPSDSTQKIEWLLWNETHKDKPIYSSLWQHRPDSRTIIFITESEEQRGSLSVKAIQDIGEPTKPKEESPPLPK